MPETYRALEDLDPGVLRRIREMRSARAGGSDAHGRYLGGLLHGCPGLGGRCGRGGAERAGAEQRAADHRANAEDGRCDPENLPAARAIATADRRRWLILGTVGLAQLMVVLDGNA